MPLRPHVYHRNFDGDCGECPLPEENPIHVVPVLPDTPYAGTSGWSGSDTSRERAEDADDDGTTSARHARVLADLASRGRVGATWREIAERNGWHHGQASGALSVLHKTGRIARLTERRDRCLVYVLPEHVDDRDTRPHGRAKITPAEEEALTAVEEAIADGVPVPAGHLATVAAALRRLAR